MSLRASLPTANYFDGKYLSEIHKKYGSKTIASFPNLTLFQFLKWCLFYQQKFIRSFWYMDYSKEKAKIELTSKPGWQDYGGHHLENLATAFGHEVWLPRRFGLDFRNLKISADVRNGRKFHAMRVRPCFMRNAVQLKFWRNTSEIAVQIR